MSEQITVTTKEGNRYPLGRLLGKGGQGSVYAVPGERLAVKILDDRSSRSRDKLRDRLAMVRRLPIEDLAVARPLELLEAPHVGYVMELFTGMVPLRSLMRPPRDVEHPGEWYFSGGGLKRRLRLLAKTAQVLAELHGEGLAYVDPSPHNVFISEEPDGYEVRLIDPDNLRVTSRPGPTVYTPGYGAPELVRATGAPNSLTDVWAFAVVAFETLSLTHPLLGDAVQDGEPELEDAALSGQMPWVDDPDDESNRSSTGIPREWVLSKNLKKDFQQIFGPGSADPVKRPGMSRWAEHLHRAADRTVTCPECDGSYYFNHPLCSWCDADRPSILVVAALLWNPDRATAADGDIEENPGIVREPTGKTKVVDAVVVNVGESTRLSHRFTHGENSSTPMLALYFDGRRLEVSKLGAFDGTLVSNSGKSKQALASEPVDIAIGSKGAGWLLHTGPMDRLHRVLRFDLRPGR